MGGTVTVFSPDGVKGDIPYDQLPAAVKAGAKPSVSMKAPDGTIGDVPADKYQDAAKAGATVVPLENQENKHPSVWSHFLGAVNPFHAPDAGHAALGRVGAATVAGPEEEEAFEQQNKARKDAGYSLPYRIAAPVMQGVTGNAIPTMEKGAREGDVNEVIGGGLAGAATAATPLIAEGLGKGGKALATSETAGKVAQTVGAVARASGHAAEELPVVGKVIKAGKAAAKVGPELRDIWSSKPTAPNPPAAESVGPIGAQANEAPAASVKPTVTKIADQVQEGLGGKKLLPNVPLRMQPGGPGPKVPPVAATIEPEHMGQFARANGLDLHRAIPESVEGDVLRAKIHNMSNIQVRQLAINAGEDMGQARVGNRKMSDDLPRQEVLKRVMAKHSPEEIGQMIDQGKHLPGNGTPQQ